jgi:hypothetical protein
MMRVEVQRASEFYAGFSKNGSSKSGAPTLHTPTTHHHGNYLTNCDPFAGDLSRSRSATDLIQRVPSTQKERRKSKMKQIVDDK